MMLPFSRYWPCDEYLSCPDPCERAYQWNMENTDYEIAGVACSTGFDIGLRGAYAIQETCSVKIGFADTGCDSDHEDLEDNLDTVLGRNFTSEDSLDWEDEGGHGTRTAGIIGALHSGSPGCEGVAGICGLRDQEFEVLVPMKVWPDLVIDEDAVISYLIDALAWASDRFPAIPIIVIEVALSDYPFGSPGISEESQFAVRNAVYNSYHTGLFLPAPAGNVPYSPREKNIYPAAIRHMTTGVTAVGCDSTREDQFWKARWIDLSAPSAADHSHPDTASIPQIVTTNMGGGYAGIDGGGFYGGTSAATPHVGGGAGLLLSHTSSLTNEDLFELLVRGARDMGDSGYDTTFGHGLLRIDSALLSVNTFPLTHDSTSSITSYTRIDSCREQYFKNITLAAATPWTPNFVSEDYTRVKADLFEFRSIVSLPSNTNRSHTPVVWVRGRQSMAARDTVRYDGYFEPYTGDVLSVSSTQAKLRGYTYRIWNHNDQGGCDTLYGWYPVKLPLGLGSSFTVFSFSYLPDTTSARSGGSAPAHTALGLRVGRALLVGGEPGCVRFRCPEGHRADFEIYDVTGRRVRALSLEPGPAGWREILWDGRDSERRRIPSGMYFGRLRVSSSEARISFLVLR
jgi:hypothetical protein